MKLIKSMKKINNFLFIGGINTVLSYFIFVTLFFLLEEFAHYLIIYFMAYFICIFISYYSMKTFVFKSARYSWTDFFKTKLLYIVSLAFNSISLIFLVECLQFYPILAQGIVIPISAASSYIGFNYFIFKK